MRTVTTSRAPLRLRKKTPAYQTTELWFTIVPPPHICSDVSVLRDDIQYLIGHGFDGQRSMPVISLFRYKGEYAQDLLDILEERARGWQPFNVFLKDFGYTVQGNNNRTIYMDIINRYALTDLVEHLTGESEGIYPYIPLAQNLQPADFLKCWPYLKGLNYGNQHFPCTDIAVFKRENGKWVKAKTISFT
jgi:hypothetical protein